MRELSLDELELIFGAGDLDTVTVEGPCACTSWPPPPHDWPDPGPGGPGDNGGGGAPPAPSPPPPACLPNYGPQTLYDLALLARHEGNINVANVPSSSSGATVGVGVDLSRWRSGDLRSWGVSEAEISSLSRYLAPTPGAPGVYGPMGSAATALLPLTVSDALRDTLSEGARNAILNMTNSNWVANSHVQHQGNFFTLPAALQTVLFDASYVFGPYMQSSSIQLARDFYSAMTWGRFGEAANVLSALGATNQRFRDLAAILNAAISNNEVPIVIETAFC